MPRKPFLPRCSTGNALAAGAEHMLAPPYRIDGERLPVRRPPPVLGEGTADVLRSVLGLDDEALAQLRRDNVL